MYINLKKISVFIFCSLTGIAAVAADNKPVLAIQHWQTSNGAQVYFVATPEIPMLQVNVLFAAGSSRDGNKPGLAQLTNDMLDQGTKDFSADQIADTFDSVGAIYGDSVNRDMASISLQSLTEEKYLTPALQMFANVLAAPNFPQAAFVRQQKQALAAIVEQQQTPDTVAKNSFFAALYGTQPYAHPVMGMQQSVASLTTADTQRFYNTYYVAKNAVVTIVGAVNKAQAEKIAEQVVGKLAAGQAASVIAKAPNLLQGNVQRIDFPSAQTNIFMGQIGINYSNPDYFSLMVGNYILGGAPLTSRLFNQVREKRGLAYSVGSVFSPLAANGPFAVVLQTRNDQADQALQVVNTTLHDFIVNGPSETELASTKRKIINGFPLTLAGNDAISGYLAVIGFYRLPLNYLDTYREKVNAVTLAQVKSAFARNVHPDKMVTVMVGKTSTVAKQ